MLHSGSPPQEMFGEGFPAGIEGMWRNPNEQAYQFAEDCPELGPLLCSSANCVAQLFTRDAINISTRAICHDI